MRRAEDGGRKRRGGGSRSPGSHSSQALQAHSACGPTHMLVCGAGEESRVGRALEIRLGAEDRRGVLAEVVEEDAGRAGEVMTR